MRRDIIKGANRELNSYEMSWKMNQIDCNENREK